MSDITIRPVRCLGWGEKEGRCENEAGTPWTPLWCHECDEQRRAHITRQLEEMTAKCNET